MLAKRESARFIAGDIPGYRVLEEVIEATSSRVYRAIQESTGLTVALKLQEVGHGSKALTRFDTEVRSLSRMRHRCIARVVDSGTCSWLGGVYAFIATEFIDGKPITQVARSLPVRARVSLVFRLCDAVQDAHEQGVVHRDLHPRNVRVNREGQLKVIDFDTACLSGEGPRPTQKGDLLGTLEYSAPEQLLGEVALSNQASVDVYSLGALLFEMLTGRPPHVLEHLSLKQALHQVQQPPVSVRRLQPDIRPDLERIVTKALAQDPSVRYRTPRALAKDLECFLLRKPISARAPGFWYRLRLYTQRHPARALGILGLTLMLAATTVAWQSSLVALEKKDRAVGSFTRLMRDRLIRNQELYEKIGLPGSLVEADHEELLRMLAAQRREAWTPELEDLRWTALGLQEDFRFAKVPHRDSERVRRAAVQHFQSRSEQSQDPLVLQQLSHCLIKLGDLLHELRGPKEARQLYLQAYELDRGLYELRGTPKALDDLCWSHLRLAGLELASGHNASANVWLEQLEAFADSLLVELPEDPGGRHVQCALYAYRLEIGTDAEERARPTKAYLEHARALIWLEPDRRAYLQHYEKALRKRLQHGVDLNESIRIALDDELARAVSARGFLDPWSAIRSNPSRAAANAYRIGMDGDLASAIRLGWRALQAAYVFVEERGETERGRQHVVEAERLLSGTLGVAGLHPAATYLGWRARLGLAFEVERVDAPAPRAATRLAWLCLEGPPTHRDPEWALQMLQNQVAYTDRQTVELGVLKCMSIAHRMLGQEAKAVEVGKVVQARWKAEE